MFLGLKHMLHLKERTYSLQARYEIWNLATTRAPLFTYGIRATPMSGGRAVVWSQPCRCCVSGRRSAAGDGGRMASWLEQLIWRGSFPLLHSTACARVGPRCTRSAPPMERSEPGPKPLGIVWESEMYCFKTKIWWNNPSFATHANKLFFTDLHITHCLSRWRQRRTALPLFCSWWQDDADSQSESSHLPYTSLRSEPSPSRYCCPSTTFP